MNLRLRNFRIKITGEEGEIPLWERLTEKGIYLRTATENARLISDYDSLRNCAGSYEYLEREISGPGLVSIPTVQATLFCKRGANELLYDLSSHFNDYYAMHAKLIPSDKLVHICKLWRLQDCVYDKAVAFVHCRKTGTSNEFIYANPSW